VVDYQSLYRRYRPQRFSEVRGQDHVVNALRHAVGDNRVAHAYLFSGPRGTGKTSTARILAKALNCTNQTDGEPCGVCDSCVDITRGASFDVHELDAASNNKVEEMRELVARASLATPGRWKVYIVDEVHMLSNSASNALLKTLEEPPDHVVFVLATTDSQKVLPTIRSRTQHYEFHLLDADVLEELLAEVARDAELVLPEAAVEAAVRRGRGSARDALSALDQVVAAGVVEDDTPFLQELLVSLAERDTARALQAIDAALAAGNDAPRIATGLLDELRRQFLSALAPSVVDDADSAVLASGSPTPHGDLLLGPARSVRAMELLGTAMVAMRDALDTRITLEVAIVRLTHPEVDDEPAALLERIERLERRVQDLSAMPAAPPPPPPPAIRPPTPGSKAPGADRPSLPAGEATETVEQGRADLGAQPALGAFANTAPPLGATRQGPSQPPAPAPTTPSVGVAPVKSSEANLAPPTRDELVEAWGDRVLSTLRPFARSIFAAGRFLANDEATAVMALPNEAHVDRARQYLGEVTTALEGFFGRPVGLRLVTESDAGSQRPSAEAPGARSDPPSSASSARARQGAHESTPAEHTHSPTAPDNRPAAVQRAAVGNDPDEGQDEMLDPDDLDPLGDQVPGDALSWAEERLLQVFPGAEEV
jgi:DNA polymerase-3 subunit gamma/tau